MGESVTTADIRAREWRLRRARIEGLKEALAIAEEWAAWLAPEPGALLDFGTSTVVEAIRARIEQLEEKS